MRILIISALLIMTAYLQAEDLRFAHIFQDHMVLQRDMTVPVWGWAAAGTEVTVTFAGQSKKAQAGDDGYWRVNLDALPVNAEGQDLRVEGGGANKTCTDILVGEVWFVAGQSNMARSAAAEMGIFPMLKERAGETDFPNIRAYKISTAVSETPLRDVDPRLRESATWQAFKGQSAFSNMALAFFFARKLHKDLDVPFGLIQVAVSGTTQTAWTPRETLDATAAANSKDKLDYETCYERAVAGLAKSKKSQIKSWDDFLAEEKAWKEVGKGRWPGGVVKNFPSVLYNAQVNPYIPFAFRGVIWHQGEGGPQENHGGRMVALINEWRKRFENDFYYIWGALSRNTSQTPPLEPIALQHYRIVRNMQFQKAQKQFGYDKKSYFVDFADLGNNDTHWGEKDKGGERMALAALNHIYGQSQVYTGPQFDSFEAKAGEIRIKFVQVGTGLEYKPSIDGISGFVIEQGDELWWGEPSIEGTDTIVFTDERITDQTNVFYAYTGNSHETLFNKEGFPASIFQMREGNYPRIKATIHLVEVMNPVKAKAALSVTHVRTNVYAFEVRGRLAKGTFQLKVYIPKDWDSATLRKDETEEVLDVSETDANGRRFALIDVEGNKGHYVIYHTAQKEAAEAELDLTRF